MKSLHGGIFEGKKESGGGQQEMQPLLTAEPDKSFLSGLIKLRKFYSALLDKKPEQKRPLGCIKRGARFPRELNTVVR